MERGSVSNSQEVLISQQKTIEAVAGMGKMVQVWLHFLLGGVIPSSHSEWR